MEAKGFVFARKEAIGPARRRQVSLAATVLRAERRRPGFVLHREFRPGEDTRQPNPYVEVRADSGDIAITLLCRNKKFVGARLETALSNTSAVAMLTEAAGPPVRASRDYDGQDAPAMRYVILAQSEDRALKTAYLACADKKLAREHTEKQRIQTGNPRVPDSGPSTIDDASELRGAALFKLIWDAVADVLGTTATAALLRRAARRASPRSPELDELAVSRTDAGYTYTLPRALVGKVEHTPVALRELVRELRPLLVELTGQVVVRRIGQIPALQDRGILSAA